MSQVTSINETLTGNPLDMEPRTMMAADMYLEGTLAAQPEDESGEISSWGFAGSLHALASKLFSGGDRNHQ